MKTYTVLAALTMLAMTTYARNDEPGYFAAPSSYDNAGTAKAERGYLACLATANDGVLESALAHVAMMKLALPGNDYRLLKARVAEVARTAASPEIRYKAFLTGAVLENADIFGAVAKGYETPDEFFSVIASRLGEYYASR